MPIDLFEPYRIGKLELKNRFVRSAAVDRTADSSGAVTDGSVAIIQELAQGGVGLIVTGACFISPDTFPRGSSGFHGAHTDDMIPGLRRLAQIAHQEGAKIALQIVHHGARLMLSDQSGMTTLAVSRLPKLWRPHREMTDEEIEAIISDYASAALRGRKAGFDAVQLHGCHGSLFCQFLSPLLNLRTDRWGGSTENRRRFHLEVIRRIRNATGADFPLMIKFGVKDDTEKRFLIGIQKEIGETEGGLSLSEGVETARQMVMVGIDAIEASTSGTSAGRAARKDQPERPYFRDRAAAVKQAVSVPVIAEGGIRSLEMAKSIVDSGDADLISMCRPLIREPDLIARWQKGEVAPSKCISCNKCLRISLRNRPLVQRPFVWCREALRLREEGATKT